jgi:hypothetical protein
MSASRAVAAAADKEPVEEARMQAEDPENDGRGLKGRNERWQKHKKPRVSSLTIAEGKRAGGCRSEATKAQVAAKKVAEFRWLRSGTKRSAAEENYGRRDKLPSRLTSIVCPSSSIQNHKRRMLSLPREIHLKSLMEFREQTRRTAPTLLQIPSIANDKARGTGNDLTIKKTCRTNYCGS